VVQAARLLAFAGEPPAPRGLVSHGNFHVKLMAVRKTLPRWIFPLTARWVLL